MKTLLLWDIDGTLITAHGAGLEALRRALTRSFGILDDLSSLELAGRTDRWIFRKMLEAFQLDVSPKNIAALHENYLKSLPETLSEKGVRLLPGIAEILVQAENRGDTAQGLLTGNLVAGAELKLKGAKIWQHFAFGAFSDDSENRNDLGPIACARAQELHKREFQASRTWVIGDTPLDVACGKAAGLRTIAIATGKYSPEQLKASAPDLFFKDLSDTAAFWQSVE